MSATPLGPFETGSAAMLAVRPEDGSFTGREALADLLKTTLQTAHVDLGDWDRTVLGWLAGLDVQTVAAVTGWIGRAYEAGLGASPGSAASPAETGPAVVEVLRSAADALAAGLATWEAHAPGDPAPEARRARRAAIATADAVTITMSRLRVRLGGDRS